MTRRGDTLLFDAPPTVAAWAAAGGKKESEGQQSSHKTVFAKVP